MLSAAACAMQVVSMLKGEVTLPANEDRDEHINEYLVVVHNF